MSAKTCPKCSAELGAMSLNGACPGCGATYKATFTSKLYLYLAVFVGVLFGPLVIVPAMARAGVAPQSGVGMAMGAMGSVTAVLFLGALSLRLLKHEWSAR